jgi:hypothetical protein
MGPSGLVAVLPGWIVTEAGRRAHSQRRYRARTGHH